jgi:Flp pilus assembly pilin Flp
MSEHSGASATPGRTGGPTKLAAAFHRDERGLKVVEMLLLLFVAAIILIGFLKIFFPEVLQRVKGKVMELLDMEVTG